MSSTMAGMGRTWRILTLVATGAFVALLVAGWWYFAPPQLGGHTSYVTTVGNSMEPGIRAGDLVLVRPAASYGVGDVVAYRSASLDAVVLHRIVGVQDGSFVLKGDHNSWTDADHPTRDDVLGTMAVRLPGWGDRLRSMRSPSGLALLLGLGMLGSVAGSFGRRRRHRSAEIDGEPRRPTAGDGSRRLPLAPTRLVPRALGVTAAALVALGALTFAWPSTTSVTRGIAYEQQGTFTYEAPVPGGTAVYGPDGIVTGDPVYLRLADLLQVSFTYRLEAPASADVTGTIGLVARVSDADGWVREFELAPTKELSGAEAEVDGTLDLGSLQGLIAEVQRLTKVERDGYTVTLVPEVRGTAALSGRSVPLSFAPELPFLLNDRELQIAPSDTPVSTLLRPTSGDLLEVRGAGPNEVSVLGLHVTPAQLRAAAFAVAAVLLLALWGLVVVSRRSGDRGEHERIEARYGRMLVSVAGGASEKLAQTIDVDSMETLVLLAAHYDQVVFHEEHSGRHTYFFRDGGIAYRYRSRAEVDPGVTQGAVTR